MHPLLNAQIVEQYREDLLREAAANRLANLARKANANNSQTRSFSLYQRGMMLWQLLSFSKKPGVVLVQEVKPAVEITFSALHKEGAVSDYDDCFIDKFIQRLEQELAKSDYVASAPSGHQVSIKRQEKILEECCL